jgi:hypothetical protein
MHPWSKGTGDANVTLKTAGICTILLSKVDIVPDEIEAGLETFKVVLLVSTFPPSPA